MKNLKTKQPKQDSLTQFSSAIKREVAYFGLISRGEIVSVYKNYYMHENQRLPLIKYPKIGYILMELTVFLLTLTGLIHAKVHKEKKRKEKKRIYGTG